ncbi:hypothetical protein RA263_02975 [Pseudomonas syringae pv. tagetis]|uniref:Secreted protein n=2 Tax=Pseudomonas syringae group genomosp. 7 TaxID=251699 RepID=A0A0Q0EAR1_9PSED|nr:hypothetical protein [Pseudomonas syringae group genomosp. 7]KPX42666.1 Uncharacterized protein ALO68_03216 [Pseudomonas syringae pv. helianthi]KPY83435.1 Uncharacterized protein ALO44_00258 [Pseudomonas syringae pv. tagetis]RMV43475.1 hypothetical protein ALP10_03690 [Pseudomonas syringae pv. helianthi]RMW07450.1 hypothetical protein ALO98_100169 [Pseudomonas syringae pv. tagetis]RMW14034.1 hypothetical protein ALO97_100184 [Pseudomonas syringae pv. tagetis]
MKRTALTGLFLSAALLASPVFAADDLCAANIKTIENAHTSSGTNLSTENKAMLETTVKNAKAAQAQNDEKKCIEITTKTITSLKNTGSGSEGTK